MNFFLSDKKLNGLFDERTRELQTKLRDVTTAYERTQIGENREAVSLLLRQYAAAETGRSQSDWMTASGNPTADIRNGYTMILKRARDLFQNDPTGHHIPITYVNNICGPLGFTFQSKVMNEDGVTADVSANKILETGYWDWGTPLHCTVGGRLSWRGVQELMTLHWTRCGEGLCEHRMNDSKYGYQLKPLQPELIDITYNTELRNGNIVVQGIELNQDERVVAYWLKVPTPSSRIYGITELGKRERVEASRLYHVFNIEHACQVRGVSTMAPIMTRMKLLSDYERFQWIAAKVNSALALMFKDQSGSQIAEPLTKTIGATNPETKRVEIDFSEFMSMDIGKKDMIIDRAKFPNEMYGTLTLAMLSRIGSGTELDLPLVSNDPSQVNFSSARFGAANTQENFKRLQETFKDQFHFWVYRDWLQAALLKGVLKFASGKSLPFSKFDKFASGATFTGRRWEFIQPLQDVMAKVVAAKMRWLSDQQYFAEKGMDMDETYSEIQAASQLRDTMGIPSELDAEIMGMVESAMKLDAAEGKNDDDTVSKAAGECAERITRILKTKRNGHAKEATI